MSNPKYTRLTFDTLAFANELKNAGMDARQAEALAQAEAKIHETSLEEIVTKHDLQIAIRDLKLWFGTLLAAVGIVTVLTKLL